MLILIWLCSRYLRLTAGLWRSGGSSSSWPSANSRRPHTRATCKRRSAHWRSWYAMRCYISVCTVLSSFFLLVFLFSLIVLVSLLHTRATCKRRSAHWRSWYAMRCYVSVYTVFAFFLHLSPCFHPSEFFPLKSITCTLLYFLSSMGVNQCFSHVLHADS